MGDETPQERGEADDLRVALNRLLQVTGASFEQRGNLERALDSRIVIEQAKGILAERLRLDLDGAFELLRRTSRSTNTRIHDLAQAVVDEPTTPRALLGELTAMLGLPGPRT